MIAILTITSECHCKENSQRYWQKIRTVIFDKLHLKRILNQAHGHTTITVFANQFLTEKLSGTKS